MKTVITLLLAFFTLSAIAVPSRNDCNYYLDVERDFKCGFKGYPLKFGYRLCEKYLEAQPGMTRAVQRWFPKIRYCLQNYLETERASIRDCKDLHRKAINSHINCYVQTGFCDLSVLDQAQIVQVTAFDILNPDVMGLSLRVKAACMSK